MSESATAPLSAEDRSRLREERALPRLMAGDPSLWPPALRDGVEARLGWRDLPTDFPAAERRASLARRAREAGVETVLLLGMGGSSLGSAVIDAWLPDGRPGALRIADSTHPDALRGWVEGVDPARTWLVAASKSGATVETRSLLAILCRWLEEAGLALEDHCLVITDPGSPLDHLAASWRARVTPPDIFGGRFSALSDYGLLAVELAGGAADAVLAGAAACTASLRAGEASAVEDVEDQALLLAAASRSRASLELVPDGERTAGLAQWLEQLVAESLGQGGQGPLPVVAGRGGVARRPAGHIAWREVGATAPAAAQGRRRMAGPRDLGAEFVRWQVATALAGWLLGISPFEQPDVERTKEHTRRLLEGSPAPALVGDDAVTSREIVDWTAAAAGLGAATIQVYAAATPRIARHVQAFCEHLSAAIDATVSWAWGPRYLHSTGQLHKGGGPLAVLQIVAGWRGEDPAIPGAAFGLGHLMRSQAAGDAAALEALGRPVLRLQIPDSAEEGLEQVLQPFLAGS